MAMRYHSSIHSIGRDSWDACNHDSPLTSYDFLAALEDSHSVCARRGWQPHHLTCHDEAGDIIAVVPLYIKSHSRGEFIFDDGWADAIERSGRFYYPKLLAGVPLTPCGGRRFLLRDPHDDAIRHRIVAALQQQHDFPSIHIAFPHDDDRAVLHQAGFAFKSHCQFHWRNHAFSSFDDFLATLRSAKRKQIKKERAWVQNQLTIDTQHGDELSLSDWQEIYDFYRHTTNRKWGGAYLTEDFFPLLSERMGENIVIHSAYDKHRAKRVRVAMALHIRGADTLYGRYWGGISNVSYLHFELCYYQAIEYAIKHGLARVEAGAQGEHKLLRGYEPNSIYSAHFFHEQQIQRLIRDALKTSDDDGARLNRHLANYLPQKRNMTTMT